MSTGTMTSKGQITVPKDVRRALGLTPGTKVSFTRNAEGDYVMSARKPALMDLAGRLEYAGQPVSLEDMESAIVDGATDST